jgi:hypothetical protein
MHGEHIMIHLLKYLLYCISNGQETKRMLFTTKRGIWQLYHGDSNLNFDGMIMTSTLY